MEKPNEKENRENAEQRLETAIQCYARNAEGIQLRLDEINETLSGIMIDCRQANWGNAGTIACIHGMLSDVVEFIRLQQEIEEQQ